MSHAGSPGAGPWASPAGSRGTPPVTTGRRPTAAAAAVAVAAVADQQQARDAAVQLLLQQRWQDAAQLLEAQCAVGASAGSHEASAPVGAAAAPVPAAAEHPPATTASKERLQLLALARLHACAPGPAGVAEVLCWAAAHQQQQRPQQQRQQQMQEHADDATAGMQQQVAALPAQLRPAGTDGGAGAAPQPQQQQQQDVAFVKRQQRRLSVLVHPDKCPPGWPTELCQLASAAFRRLHDGCQQLLRQAGGGDTVPLAARKRSRPADGSGGRAGSGDWQGAGDGGAGSDGADGDSYVSGGEEDPAAAWWQEWVFHSAAPPWPSTLPGEGDQEPLLWKMEVQALEEEVSRRQREVLRPLPGSDAAALPVHARQKRLRVARSVLSERSATAAAAARMRAGGGFV